MVADTKGASGRGSLLSGEALTAALARLRQLPVAAKLREDAVKLLVNDVQIREYRSGALVVRYGEPGDSFFIVIDGVVSARRVDARGKELRYGSMGAGSIFGELAILTKDPRGTDVVAESVATVAEVTAQSFQQLLTESPQFSMHILTLLANRFRINSDRLTNLSFLDLNQRLLLLLSGMATRVTIGKSEMTIVRELPSRQHLASLLSCSREAVSRSLRQLEDQGAILVEGDQVQILAGQDGELAEEEQN
jgi:CRP-like cAMP-binding protein